MRLVLVGYASHSEYEVKSLVLIFLFKVVNSLAVMIISRSLSNTIHNTSQCILGVNPFSPIRIDFPVTFPCYSHFILVQEFQVRLVI